MTSTYTKQGIAAQKAGNGHLAKQLLEAAVAEDPNDELAWLWLSGAVDSTAEKRNCLERVLAINPHNSAARHGLSLLESQHQAPQIEPPTTAPASSPSITALHQPSLRRMAGDPVQHRVPQSTPAATRSHRRRTIAGLALAAGIIGVLGLIIMGLILRQDKMPLAIAVSPTQRIVSQPSGSATLGRPPTWTPTPTPAPTLTHVPSPTSTPKPPPEQLQPIIDEVSRIRELEPIAPIEYAFSSRINSEIYLDDSSVLPAYPLWDELRALGLVKMIGPSDFLKAVDLMNYRLAGIYYSISEKTLHVFTLSGELVPQEYPSVAYEYVRALADMNFGLDRFYPTDASTDASLALRALAEGDAMLSLSLSRWSDFSQGTVDRFADNLSRSESQLKSVGISSAVYWLKSFPFVEGWRFNQALYEQGDWSTINQAYAAPPASTEQVLHPEKYLATAPELPRPLALPEIDAPLKAGYDLVVSNDTLGEYLLSLVLTEFDSSETRARQAAAGWDGDVFSAWVNFSGDQIYVLLSGWDTEDDAREFEESATRMLSKRTGVEPAAGANPQATHFNGNPSVAYLHRIGDQALIIWCSGTDLRNEILAALPGF